MLLELLTASSDVARPKRMVALCTDKIESFEVIAFA